jgi:iron complex transport system substrate-binding protein
LAHRGSFPDFLESMRVISLLPAATEMVAALGALEQLVAVSHECDYPPPVRRLPSVTRNAVELGVSAGEIDARVRELTSSGLPLFVLDEHRIASLAPDVIVTQAVCDVCAVSEDDVRALAARIDPAPRVVSLGASSFDGVFDDLRRIAVALDVVSEADELTAGLHSRLRRIHEALAAARAPRPRVAVVEWTDPIYVAGHWVPEMIRRAGGIDVCAAPGAHSTRMDAATIAARDPQVVLLAPCGFDLGRAATEAELLFRSTEWAWARGRRIAAIDGNALTSRPGPRIVSGVEVIAAILNPDVFPGVKLDPTRARVLA